MQRLFIMVSSVFFVCLGSVQASALKPTISLNQIKMIKAQEQDGDELYFTTSTYRAGRVTQYERIPEKPKYLSAQRIKTLSGLNLWAGNIDEGQVVTIHIALNELDPFLLDADELIGTMRVTLKNKDGKLASKWSIPNRMDGPEVISGQSGPIYKFDLMGPSGRYEVFLSVST